MTDIAFSSRNACSDMMTLTLVLTPAKKTFEVMREWRSRYRSRHEQASYTCHERNDLRFPSDEEAEIAKRFWRK